MLNQFTTSATSKATYTIGAFGVAGCDYNFASAANANEQSIQLGATTIIPALSPVFRMTTVCLDGLNGAITGTSDVGLTSGSAEYMSAVNVDDTNEIAVMTVNVVPQLAASSIYFSFTPNANWNTITNGKWTTTIYFLV